MKILQFDETSSFSLKANILFITLLVAGLLIMLQIFALRRQAMFGHIITFPERGWVVKIKIKDHPFELKLKFGLSLAMMYAVSFSENLNHSEPNYYLNFSRCCMCCFSWPLACCWSLIRAQQADYLNLSKTTKLLLLDSLPMRLQRWFPEEFVFCQWFF